MSMDKCEICGGLYIGGIYVVLAKKQPNGKYNTIVCLRCAKKSGLYCKKHKRPYVGFEDGTFACIDCIEVKAEKWAEKISKMLSKVIQLSPHKDHILDSLRRYSRFNKMLLGSSYKVNVARAIVTYALRKRKNIKRIIRELCQKGPQLILTEEFLEEPYKEILPT